LDSTFAATFGAGASAKDYVAITDHPGSPIVLLRVQAGGALGFLGTTSSSSSPRLGRTWPFALPSELTTTWTSSTPGASSKDEVAITDHPGSPIVLLRVQAGGALGFLGTTSSISSPRARDDVDVVDRRGEQGVRAPR
jgi:hypothetical protein